MIDKIKAFVASKGGWAHVIAIVYASLIAAYGMVPAFHDLVLHVWGVFPPWARETTLAIGGLIAWYKTTNAKT